MIDNTTVLQGIPPIFPCNNPSSIVSGPMSHHFSSDSEMMNLHCKISLFWTLKVCSQLGMRMGYTVEEEEEVGTGGHWADSLNRGSWSAAHGMC